MNPDTIAAAIASLHDTATLMAETQRPVLAQLAAQNDVLVAFAKRHDEHDRRHAEHDSRIAALEASQHVLAARQEQDRAAVHAETADLRREFRRSMRQMRLVCLAVGLTGVLVGYLLG